MKLGNDPRTGKVIAKGIFAAILIGPDRFPREQKMTRERVGLHVEIRIWNRIACAPSWHSAGVYRIPIHRYAALWVRAMLYRPERIPTAKTVQPCLSG